MPPEFEYPLYKTTKCSPSEFVLESLLNISKLRIEELELGATESVERSVDASMVLFTKDQQVVVYLPDAGGVGLLDLGLRNFLPSMAPLERLIGYRALARLGLKLADIVVHPQAYVSFSEQRTSILAEATILNSRELRPPLSKFTIDKFYEMIESKQQELLSNLDDPRFTSKFISTQLTLEAVDYVTEELELEQ